MSLLLKELYNTIGECNKLRAEVRRLEAELASAQKQNKAMQAKMRKRVTAQQKEVEK